MIRSGCKSVSIFAIFCFVTRINETYHVARHAYNTHLPCCQNQTAPKICIALETKILEDLIFECVSPLHFYSQTNLFSDFGAKIQIFIYIPIVKNN